MKEFKNLCANCACLVEDDNGAWYCDEAQCKCEDVTECPEKCDTGSTNTTRRPSVYEYNRVRVYATGNRWAIENFEATH